MSDLDHLWRIHAAPTDVLERRPDFRFDPDFFGARYPDLDQDPKSLMRNFEEFGRIKGEPPNFYTLLRAQHPAIDAVLLELVTDPQLAEAIAAGEPDACQLACELIHLGAPVDANVSDFSMQGYLVWHPDIERAGMDPLMHYLCHGAVEGGRRTLADVRQRQYRGRKPYTSERPNCLIAVHEMSRSGAPMVGLELLRGATQSHNVIVAARRGGESLEDFRNYACEVVITERPLEDFIYFTGDAFSHIDFAIINSVESYTFAPFLVARQIPFATYIHEYTEYTFPAHKSTFSALFSDLLVFSSEHVRNSWAGRLKDIKFNIASDSIILAQRAPSKGSVTAAAIANARKRLSDVIGRDLADVRLICGAGHLQWRKGSDIFVMTAQISRHRDPNTIFLWIGDGLNLEDTHFGAWFDYHLRQVNANQPDSNLFFIPTGRLYPDVVTAADAMLLSSRMDPLPNAVFDGLEHGCHIVYFDGSSGFNDQIYRKNDNFTAVEYANPEAAATALLTLPRKTCTNEHALPTSQTELFDRIHKALQSRLQIQKYFVWGASEFDVPMLFTSDARDSELRRREREKMLRYHRRLVWRDRAEVEATLASSDNWIHQQCKLAPYSTIETTKLPSFSIHIHAYYTDELAVDLESYAAYAHARRIVVTTDSERKVNEIHSIMSASGLHAEVLQVPNRGRDILPFMQLFESGGAAGGDDLWCHVHQKKSIGTARDGDIWKQFMLRILLGNDRDVSAAISQIGQNGVGLVAPLDPYHISWNASRALLPKFAGRLPGPMPDNPLLFPIGNMFWVRRQVVEAMNAFFGPDYPWPNEPIASDGTEFHLIERLWPAMAAHLKLDSVFVHKLDEQRA